MNVLYEVYAAAPLAHSLARSLVHTSRVRETAERSARRQCTRTRGCSSAADGECARLQRVVRSDRYLTPTQGFVSETQILKCQRGLGSTLSARPDLGGANPLGVCLHTAFLQMPTRRRTIECGVPFSCDDRK
jgi:hypothetical protein